MEVGRRGSVTGVAPGDGRTIVRGGAGMFYNSVPRSVASFEQMQSRVVTQYAQDGMTPLGAPVEIPNVVLSGLRTPRSVNWNIEVDREWLKDFFVRVGYQQRENRFESVVDQV